MRVCRTKGMVHRQESLFILDCVRPVGHFDVAKMNSGNKAGDAALIAGVGLNPNSTSPICLAYLDLCAGRDSIQAGVHFVLDEAPNAIEITDLFRPAKMCPRR